MPDNEWLWYLIGGLVVALFGFILSVLSAVAGWAISKILKNSRDLNVLHTAKRYTEKRLDRIERVSNGTKTNVAEQNTVDGDYSGGKRVDTAGE